MTIIKEFQARLFPVTTIVSYIEKNDVKYSDDEYLEFYALGYTIRFVSDRNIGLGSGIDLYRGSHRIRITQGDESMLASVLLPKISQAISDK